MVRNWKSELPENASSIFEEHGKSEREAKRREAAAEKERDKMLKTIGQLDARRTAPLARRKSRHPATQVLSLLKQSYHQKDRLLADHCGL